MIQTPFHRGELEVQERAGQKEIARRNGQIISPRIPDGALGFVARQRRVVLASTGARHRPWASILFGPPGFADAPDPGTVEIDLSRASYHRDDPLWTNLALDPKVGSLFIELETRRRLRVNGTAEVAADRTLRVVVSEAYPNCPKYIRRRPSRTGDPPFRPAPPEVRRGARLEASQRRWIEAADTFFVASAHPRRGADASHRGGRPGFVQVLDSRTLRIPDYPGNGLYNTLGNLAVNPAAGLLFVDFERPATLQLSGTAEIHWDLDRPAEESGGTRRYWSVAVEEWIESELERVLE